MAARSVYSSSVSSLPPPSPKSPPEYPDLYGKRREIANIQTLEREIGFLEDELKSLQSLQPVSICCKEINDFVTANSDPLTSTCRVKQQRCRIWKWLCGFPCFNLSWLCCCSCTECSVYLEMPRCCGCKPFAANANAAVTALFQNVHRRGLLHARYCFRNKWLHNRCTIDSAISILRPFAYWLGRYSTLIRL
ncbi:guanine nucleotide-binding protein subunit gamma 3-like [Cucumis melo var. makuwa]|uniref:Guanine nucleotide-binding protein subunit gamma 3-like n=1 Tax=Cucumis melo var. makuwa TaxID=1194695 RepID=A0A5A7UQL3_CUCMM|nr:guanine nucleotide-binding protein subunit gamma 3-like [Cucumis melo var. makuwa]